MRVDHLLETINQFDDQDDQWFRMVRNDDSSDTRPSWNTFPLDEEGRIWVERLVDDSENIVLQVLSETGKLLGMAPWNRNRTIQDTKN